MITIFNRKELLITFDLKKQVKTRDLLEQNHIPYTIKVMNRESQALFEAGTRARMGSYGQNANMEYKYIIYVKKVDYEKATAILYGKL